ncbi:MAG: hypothetical protein K9M57_10910 [Phycisphaerae bacterium]|nr:hypothetical protein [Phycisphaerae bacterium]
MNIDIRVVRVLLAVSRSVSDTFKERNPLLTREPKLAERLLWKGTKYESFNYSFNRALPDRLFVFKGAADGHYGQ